MQAMVMIMRYQFLRFPGGKPKAVTFSYDDGVCYDIPFRKIVDKYGIKCTFNINSGLIEEEPGQYRLNEDEIREYLVNSPHEIAVHGENHKAPGKHRPVEVVKDVLNCRLDLEKRFGIIVRGMAYPDSGVTTFENNQDYETVRQILKDLDIVYARSLGADNDRFQLPSDWLNWIPTAHHNNPRIHEFIAKFNEDFELITNPGRRTPKLFYLWGHSYEFGKTDTWQDLETICQELGGKEDVWYATNMEIYDYVQAYYSLVFSADSTIVYNPTLKTIWFEQDMKQYVIEPGQTIRVGAEGTFLK